VKIIWTKISVPGVIGVGVKIHSQLDEVRNHVKNVEIISNQEKHEEVANVYVIREHRIIPLIGSY